MFKMANVPRICFSLLCFSFLEILGLKHVTVEIDDYYPLAAIDEKFVGVTIDTSIVKDNFTNFDFNSAKLQNLAAALAPSYIRMGGTDADFCIFSNNGTLRSRNKRDISLSKKKHWSNFTLTETDWDNINTFVQKVGWDLIFDLNALQRKDLAWDPANALSLMAYTKQKGYKVAGWELGNEPEEYATMGLGYNVTATQFAQDYQNLSTILKTQPTSVRGSIFIGPSVIPLASSHAIKYFANFFESGGGKAVTSPNFHHYYVDGKQASFKDFYDPKILNSLKQELEIANKVARQYAPGKRVWLGETSSAWDSGAPNVSDAYVAGFMWLDKLGLTARFNYGAIMRQAFVQGSYALLDPVTWDPNPDYWLTVLYKRLVGGKVFPVFIDDFTEKLRLYAHCANSQWYSEGSLVLFGMNLYESDKTVRLPQYRNQTMDLYLMQPPNGELHSRNVLLNGKLLELSSDYKLPSLHIPTKIRNQFTVPKYSYFFLVIPSAKSKECTSSK